MYDIIRQYFNRWKLSKNYKHDLDSILQRSAPSSHIQDRLDWIVDLMEWVRHKSSSADESVSSPIARIKFLLNVLERNPQWKKSVSQTLRSIIRDVSGLELFTEIGLPQELGFWSEFKNRVMLKIMPEKPLSEGLGNLFAILFPNPRDLEWLAAIDPQIMRKLIDLFFFEVSPEESNWNNLAVDLQESLVYLSTRVSAIPLHPLIRKRLGFDRVREIPFLTLTKDVENLLKIDRIQNHAEFLEKSKEFRKLIGKCQHSLENVYLHLNAHGVNVTVVYSLERIQAKLKRIDDLISFLMFQDLDTELLIYFICQMVEESHSRKSLFSLLDQNTRLLARKIVDRSAETGEHYITRDRDEYKKMFKSAAGGGAYTAVTVYIKFVIVSLGLAPFIEGLFASINYAASFLAIQFNGFTLATKQPSMTASALASKMQHIDNGESVEVLIDEIIHLIRSQVAGIIGNVGVVFPTVLFIELIGLLVLGRHLLSQEKAEYVLNSTHLFGPTIIYAAFTGVLLWISSLFAGWIDNWFVFNNMKNTLSYNRKLNFIFGREVCDRISSFFQKNISAISSNISLGFLLGLSPEIMLFFGIHLDVRHVTLATGSLAAALPQYGFDVVKLSEFWFAVAGIGLIGTLNLGVSFGLAFYTAIRSRNIKSIQRSHILRALLKRFLKKPLSFVYPTAS